MIVRLSGPVAAPIFEIDDWEGKPVRLSKTSWKHIRKNRPEMEEALDAIRITVNDPDIVNESHVLGKAVGAVRRVLSRIGPHPRYRALYVRVPIEYGPHANWVTTAYLDALPPVGEVIYARIPSR